MAIWIRHLPAVVSVVALSLTLVATASAGTRTTLNDVEDEVMCPVCGTPLNLASDAPSANDERALIRRLITQGYGKEQIKRRLAREFGPGVLALPPQRGFDLTAYLAPIVLVLAGLVAIGVLAVRWRRRRPAPLVRADGGSATPALDPADARRLDEDLARYDG
jgi:cytochrome c-type biogenesis protein CcmH/NrfF